jgi:DNA transformation protein
MPKRNEFCDHVVDLLSPLGEASYRFMFGGYGIYLDGLMVGIVADERLLLRADDENRPEYEARGIGPFQPYPEKGMGTMPYYAVPDDVFEDPEELARWVARSREAAVRHRDAKEKKGRKARGVTRG